MAVFQGPCSKGALQFGEIELNIRNTVFSFLQFGKIELPRLWTDNYWSIGVNSLTSISPLHGYAYYQA